MSSWQAGRVLTKDSRSIFSCSKVLWYSERPRCSSDAERSANSSPSSLGSSPTAAGEVAAAGGATCFKEKRDCYTLRCHRNNEINKCLDSYGPITCLFPAGWPPFAVDMVCKGETFFWFDSKSKSMREPANTQRDRFVQIFLTWLS